MPAAPHSGNMPAPEPLSQAERDDMEAAARAVADSLEAVCAGLSEDTPLNTAALDSIMEVGAQGAAASGTAAQWSCSSRQPAPGVPGALPAGPEMIQSASKPVRVWE